MHDISVDRALPLLDPAPAQWKVEQPPTRVLHRAARGAGEGQGHRKRLAGEGHLCPRADPGRGDGDEATSPAQGRRERTLADRLSDSLGLRGRSVSHRAVGESSDAIGDGRERLLPRVQDVPCEGRESVGGLRCHLNTSRFAAPPPRYSEGTPESASFQQYPSTLTLRPASGARPVRSPAKSGMTSRRNTPSRPAPTRQCRRSPRTTGT